MPEPDEVDDIGAVTDAFGFVDVSELSESEMREIVNRGGPSKCVRCGKGSIVHIRGDEGLCDSCYARYGFKVFIKDKPEFLGRHRRWVSWTAYRIRSWWRNKAR